MKIHYMYVCRIIYIFPSFLCVCVCCCVCNCSQSILKLAKIVIISQYWLSWLHMSKINSSSYIWLVQSNLQLDKIRPLIIYCIFYAHNLKFFYLSICIYLFIMIFSLFYLSISIFNYLFVFIHLFIFREFLFICLVCGDNTETVYFFFIIHFFF